MRVSEVTDGIVQITFPLPLGIDHVHCYALRTAEGWTIVDTGLGVPDAEDRWRQVLRELDAPVERIFVTHFHPDHVGAAALVAELTGAPVLQGAEDYAQCVRAWGGDESREGLVAYMVRHGLPTEEADGMRREGAGFMRLVRYARDPRLVHEDDEVDGWRVLQLPGHADGHVALLRDGVFIAGDSLLATISPNVGLYPEARPDPLGDYLESLARIIELAPSVAFAGHGPKITDPPRRARELVAHHEERLEATSAALDDLPRSAYDVSLLLFADDLSPTLRRFALAESRAHLEYLARRGLIGRLDEPEKTAYVAGRGYTAAGDPAFE